MKNKKIFITGGAGYLGSNLIKKWYNDNEITIYSRDEAKHYFLKKQFPKLNCIIGDVRNLDLMKKSSRHHDLGVFAASLKQIESVDQNIEEANEVIIRGGLNSRIVAEENLESACFISTDKSRSATTLYGAMKFVAGESFIINSENSKTNLSTAIYGNVINSTGSIIPLIWDAINNKYELKLYSNEMTRFILFPEQAVELIEFALTKNGYNIIPKVNSILIKDLFEIFAEEFSLKYKEGTPRISEKIHEIMVSQEEAPRVFEENNYYLMHSKKIYQNSLFIDNEYSSKNCILPKEELRILLKINNFFEK